MEVKASSAVGRVDVCVPRGRRLGWLSVEPLVAGGGIKAGGHMSVRKHWLQAGQLSVCGGVGCVGLGEGCCGKFSYCLFSGDLYIELIKCLETTPDL